MGNSTQYSLPPVGLALPSNVKIGKLSLLVAGTEYSYPLQNGLRQLEICSVLGTTVLQIRFQSSGEYKLIRKGCQYNVADINFTGKTVYIKGNAIDDVEIVEYY